MRVHEKEIQGIPEVGFTYPVGTTGKFTCPITKKQERVTITDVNMLMLVYSPFGYYTCEMSCEGCGRTHRIYNPRFSHKGVQTI
jgi:hypothetical protein